MVDVDVNDIDGCGVYVDDGDDDVHDVDDVDEVDADVVE